MRKVIWTPQAKQRAFMERPEEEALYGGAAGGRSVKQKAPVARFVATAGILPQANGRKTPAPKQESRCRGQEDGNDY